MSIIATEPLVRETFHIATLNDRNYQPWSMMMLAAFADSNCESIVLGEEPRPETPAVDDSDAAAKTAAITLWDKRNRSALYRIYRAISQQELITLAGITLASEAWEKLKKVHRVEGAAGEMLGLAGFAISWTCDVEQCRNLFCIVVVASGTNELLK